MNSYEWKSGRKNVCPECKKLIEYYFNGFFSYGERCNTCQWQYVFLPSYKKVKFGSKIKTDF